MTLTLFYDDRMVDHDPGANHPERPARLRRVYGQLQDADLDDTRWIEPSPADRSRIERVHADDHVDRIEELDGQSAQIDPDTRMSPGSVEAAHLAAGAAIEALETAGGDETGFALVRPPGHHAESNRAMGFCLYNNAAVAAQYALDELGVERVLVVDWDVHHGNGTQAIFDDRRDVLYFSVHRHPFYPGTGPADSVGSGEGEGYTVNVPFGPKTGDGDFLAAFERILEPVARDYDPDAVLVSAGFDAHRQDPLGGMRVSTEGFAAMCRRVEELADEVADGRLALTLEGGYDLDGLARSVEACAEVLTGTEVDLQAQTSTTGERSLRGVTQSIEEYWDLDE